MMFCHLRIHVQKMHTVVFQICITAASAALMKTTLPLSWVLHNYKKMYACQESPWDCLWLWSFLCGLADAEFTGIRHVSLSEGEGVRTQSLWPSSPVIILNLAQMFF